MFVDAAGWFDSEEKRVLSCSEKRKVCVDLFVLLFGSFTAWERKGRNKCLRAAERKWLHECFKIAFGSLTAF